MNLFDELVKDAEKDLASGKFLQDPTQQVTIDKQVEQAVDNIEKKMSDAIDNTINKIVNSAAGQQVDNNDVPGEKETENENEGSTEE